MAGGIAKRVQNPYLRDMFEYFIKYVGSSAYDAPGFMNLMPNIQLEFGLWYVSGGLYELARGFERRLAETGVTVHLGQRVEQVTHSGKRVQRVIARDLRGTVQEFDADFVVSNMEVIPANEQLLKESASTIRKGSRWVG